MKMNQGQPHPVRFSNAETVFFVNDVWNATSLFLSAIVSLKKSGVLTTGVSVVNKTRNQTSETGNKISCTPNKFFTAPGLYPEVPVLRARSRRPDGRTVLPTFRPGVDVIKLFGIVSHPPDN